VCVCEYERVCEYEHVCVCVCSHLTVLKVRSSVWYLSVCVCVCVSMSVCEYECVCVCECV